MKQLKVLVKDKNTLLLQEDGMAGDYINLNELTNVDLSNIKEINGVNTIQTIQNLKDGINSMLGMMYMLIGLLIGVSSILAVVIIYNLGVLSFSEKNYQFATLKVLGFKSKAIKKIFMLRMKTRRSRISVKLCLKVSMTEK